MRGVEDAGCVERAATREAREGEEEDEDKGAEAAAPPRVETEDAANDDADPPRRGEAVGAPGERTVPLVLPIWRAVRMRDWRSARSRATRRSRSSFCDEGPGPPGADEAPRNEDAPSGPLAPKPVAPRSKLVLALSGCEEEARNERDAAGGGGGGNGMGEGAGAAPETNEAEVVVELFTKEAEEGSVGGGGGGGKDDEDEDGNAPRLSSALWRAARTASDAIEASEEEDAKEVGGTGCVADDEEVEEEEDEEEESRSWLRISRRRASCRDKESGPKGFASR